MNYKVVKGITGFSVQFRCEKCNAGLKASLDEAGLQEACPECKTPFVVPGLKEHQAREAERKEAAKLAGQQKEEKRQLKEQQRAVQEEEKRLAAKRLEAEKLASEEAQRRKRQREDQVFRERQEAFRDTAFDVATHDWSTGAPYGYQCVEMGTVSQNWSAELSKIINTNAQNGWEYYRSESLSAFRPSGCLFFGSGETFSVVVLVFRKPAAVVQREKEILAEVK